ncbi:hypothetical protein CXB49_00140 [Chromobacterium sp. ATCC 53434]|uniref:T6SS phospholipase effector Tle1-like catalytic domain-containing protein n=1 Tax=Chromobacterium sp. (strain ATCC 53434 / SC 14030) TaxID=2059672 RepID=UPI000C759E74|nr:DUF2235 domain-containing protein [Chromobacterium sp. ATCC 53434]AUH49360.1 hypothetical protein CXB49_00140 [Chromobacterium sp. ATCC 53434]
MTLRQAGEYTGDAELDKAHATAKMARVSGEFGNALQEITPPKFFPKFTLFFDGTMNNNDVSPNNKSNVARLFLAAYNDHEKEFFPRYIAGLGTEYIPKDNPEVGADKGGTMGAGFGKGGEMRLKDAMLYIEKTLGEKYSNTMLNIEIVRVNVIGFSRGATLSRAFVNRIIKEKSDINKKGQLVYKLDFYGVPVPLEIGFLGIFDTVASVGGPALHKNWASEIRVPSEVKRCVHIVSAHEVRRAFPLDSIEYKNRYPENSEEVVYPGVHSDVGGGYYPNEQGRNLKLTKIPLRKMYLEAIKAGVGLKSLKEMDRNILQEFTPENKDKLLNIFHSYGHLEKPRGALSW